MQCSPPISLRRRFRRYSIAATLCASTIACSANAQVTQIPSPSQSSDRSATTTAEASVLAAPPVSELAATRQIPEGLATSAVVDQMLETPSRAGDKCELDAELRDALESLPAASGLGDVCQFVTWQASNRDHEDVDQTGAIIGHKPEAPSTQDKGPPTDPEAKEGPPGVTVETHP